MLTSLITAVSASEDVEILLGILQLRQRRKRLRAANRKTWLRSWVPPCQTHGKFANIIRDLNREAVEKLRQFHRLDRNSSKEVLKMVPPLIEKKDPLLRSFVKPHERSFATLRSGFRFQFCKIRMSLKRMHAPWHCLVS